MHNEPQEVTYRRALEALRSGVPNESAVQVLGCTAEYHRKGRSPEKVEDHFAAQLSDAEARAQERRQTRGILIAGDFGSGKSHLLQYLEHLALSRGFVCSRIVISKETPLFDPAKVYRAAIETAVVPGVYGQAIHEIALRLDPRSRKYTDFYQWANRSDSGISPLFAATLFLHERLSNDPELVEEIINFWSGERLSISRVKAGLKQVGSPGIFTLKTVRARDLAPQRFTFASRLILAAGYKGWVLFIDEVELIGRYSLLQRGKSYAELARWMGAIQGQHCPGSMVVAAITEDFAEAVLKRKSDGTPGDRDVVGPRLRSKETDEFLALATRAEAGMGLIERDGITLVPPDDSTLQTTYHRIKEIHSLAFGWTAPDVGLGDRSIRRPMRAHVRRWINEWDLKRIYPTALVNTEEEALRPSYSEDQDFERPSENGDTQPHPGREAAARHLRRRGLRVKHQPPLVSNPCSRALRTASLLSFNPSQW